MSKTDDAGGSPGWRRRLRRWSLELLLVAVLIAGVQWWQSYGVVSGMAPALQGTLIDGRPVSLADLRGEPVLVHFWATWCPICRLEEDSIDALAADYPVVTVATTSGTAAELRSYLQQHGLDFPVIPDEEGALGRAWGVQGVPASFIIDPDGRIAYATVGYSTGPGLRLRLWLARL